jgi:hypothetical protein
MSKKQFTSTQKAEYQAKYAALCNLTAELLPIAKAKNVKVNDLLIDMYAQKLGCGKSDFNTFFGWKEKGFKVKKGEKGYAIWSRPKDVIREEKTGQPADDETKFFGLSYMFHKGQVETLTATAQSAEPTPQEALGA